MAINKVEFGGRTLIDLTDTTATADKILTGYGAYGKDGVWVDGTAIESSPDGAVYQDSEGYVVLDDGPGTHVEIESLNVTENGTYTAPTGYAYSPVSVDVEPNLQSKSATPTESAQTITADSGYDGLSQVNVGAISSTYVGSGISRKTSSDLTVSGATVTAPAGYYSAAASKSVASGSAGTPTATKGTVSNNSVSITPSVTNTTGYITGGTKTGTAVTVSASELVSGTYNVTSSGTKDVTNYASASVPAGTVGTPTVSKGTVSNHSITVTPSVTNSTGWITGGTKTGTAATVSASELASGNKAITENGTGIDVVGYSTVSVDVEQGEKIPHYTLHWDEETGELLNYATCDMTYQQILDSIPADRFTFVCEVYQSSYDVVPLGASGENVYTGNKLVIKVMAYGTPAYVITHSANSITAQYWDYNDDSDLYVANDYVYAKSGYYQYEAGIQMPSAAQATPTMAFASATGLVTATATQTSGYVSAGTKSSTYQLPVKAAATYTPTETTQIIGSYQWLTGAQTIAAISSTYVGTGVTQRSAADMIASGSYVTAPSGYYSQAFSKAVNIGKVQLKDIQTGGNIYIDLYSSTGLLSFDYVASGSYGLSSFSAGYISAAPTSGNYSFRASASRQLPVLAATTYTPTTTAQTIPSYRWLTGSQTILGDSNLIASNIKSGVNIFSVTGTYSGESITHYVAVYDTEGDPNNYVLYNNTQYHGGDYFEAIENDTITIHIATSNSYKVYLRGELVSTSNNYAYTVWDNCAVDFRTDDNGYSAYISESEVPSDYTSGQYITPTTYEQVAARQDDYLNGNIIVYGDGNLVPSNIKSGVSIFGVVGTMEEGIVDPYYSVHMSLVNRSAISASAPMVSEWADSLSIARQGQFANQPFRGSFIFNNLRIINELAFAYARADAAYLGDVSMTFPLVSTIDTGAFLSNVSIITINAETCEYIRNRAFEQCTQLKSISFPLVTSIGTSAFYSCKSLTNISFPSATVIGDYAFAQCSSLANISFPLTTTIGNYAFYYCSKLTNISFPSATTIGYNAFSRCRSLVEANFPLAITIGNYAFHDCSALTSINFPLVTTISDYAFTYCKALTNISFPSAISIGILAFSSCTSLIEANFPSVTSIGYGAFESCSALTNINFPLATTISSYAFQNCSALTNINFPLVTIIGTYAFQNCFSLTNIDFPLVSYINAYAFQGCRSLTNISFPSVELIGYYAFSACINLSSVYLLGSSVATLQSSTAFAGTLITNTGTTGVISNAVVNGTISPHSLLWTIVGSISESLRGAPATFSIYYNVASTNYYSEDATLVLAFNNNGSWVESNWIGGRTTQDGGGHWHNYLTVYSGTKTISVARIPSDASQVRFGIYNNTTMRTATASLSAMGSVFVRSGYFYVPLSLYSSYIAATNWTYFSRNFIPLTSSEMAALNT